MNLSRRQHTELPVGAHDADLDVISCDGLLKAFLQGEDGGVDGIFQFDVLAVPLLQKGLGVPKWVLFPSS